MVAFDSVVGRVGLPARMLIDAPALQLCDLWTKPDEIQPRDAVVWIQVAPFRTKRTLDYFDKRVEMQERRIEDWVRINRA